MTTDRTATITRRVDAVLEQIAESHAALTRLDDQIGETDQTIYDLGTGHRDVYHALSGLRVAREHIQSAWRSLDYAARNLTESPAE